MRKVFLGFAVIVLSLVCASLKTLASFKEKAALKAELEKLTTGKEISVADKDSICN